MGWCGELSSLAKRCPYQSFQSIANAFYCNTPSYNPGGCVRYLNVDLICLAGMCAAMKQHVRDLSAFQNQIELASWSICECS